jgi:aminopeptidase
VLSFEQKLQNYADLAVNIGVGLQPGQRLIIRRSPVEAASLVRLIAAGAYKAGARLVDVMWHDDALTLARFQHAPCDSFTEYPAWRAETLTKAAEQGDAVLTIYTFNPDLFTEQDPELIALTQRVEDEHLRPFRQKTMADEINWCVISHPLPAWAAKIFPDDTPDEQMSKLWEIIFKICRIDQPDPLIAWQRHIEQLAAKGEYLNAKQYTALKYTAPGTNLTVGLPQNHVWKSGQSQTPSGINFIANIPTEEIFTMPHKDKVEGIVTSTKPLSHKGIRIEDFCLTFEQGRVVKAAAQSGETLLKKLLETDEGAVHLGEVALVPHSSPVSQSGLVFYNDLYDENASNHLALGKAYRFNVKNGPVMTNEEFAAIGGNSSLMHIDFMIGSDKMDVDGITRDGAVEPIMRAGEWAF